MRPVKMRLNVAGAIPASAAIVLCLRPLRSTAARKRSVNFSVDRCVIFSELSYTHTYAGGGRMQAPRNSIDEIIDLYKRGIDRGLIRENLALSPDERLRRLQDLQRFAHEMRKSGERVRRRR